MLCDLLTASGAGRPHSWFRSEDIGYWARLWGVALEQDDPAFDRADVAAMIRAGTGDTGLFGLRLMWHSVGEASRQLDAALGGHADVAARIEQAFGPTLFSHLSRRNKTAQAASLVRAERTGLWHIHADGSARQRTAPTRIGWRTPALSGRVRSWRGRMRRGPVSSTSAGSSRCA